MIDCFASLAMTAFIFFSAPCLHAESPIDLFRAGNDLYAAGKFSDAAQKYQTAADQGIKNWILEYDLGNAYYRAGQIGKAILHYERAFRMNSGQGDIIYNLNLATNKAGDPELPQSALPALAWRFFYSLSLNTLTLLTSILFISLVAALGAWLAGKRLLPQELIALAFLLFIGLAGWLGARIYIAEKPVGVVVSQVAEVRSGPNTSYPANFTVPEGHRVLILQEQEPIQGWLEVGVPDQGLKGWVPDSSVEII